MEDILIISALLLQFQAPSERAIVQAQLVCAIFSSFGVSIVETDEGIASAHRFDPVCFCNSNDSSAAPT